MNLGFAGEKINHTTPYVHNIIRTYNTLGTIRFALIYA